MIWWILVVFILIILIIGGLILRRLLKASSESSHDYNDDLDQGSYPLSVSKRGIEGARQKSRKPLSGDIGSGLTKILKEKKNTIILVLFLSLSLSLSSCLATKQPDPIIIKIPCNLAELKPLPETYDIDLIIDATCSHFACMTEEEAGQEFYNDQVKDAYIDYLVKTYNDAKRRCTGNE